MIKELYYIDQAEVHGVARKKSRILKNILFLQRLTCCKGIESL